MILRNYSSSSVKLSSLSSSVHFWSSRDKLPNARPAASTKELEGFMAPNNSPPPWRRRFGVVTSRFPGCSYSFSSSLVVIRLLILLFFARTWSSCGRRVLDQTLFVRRPGHISFLGRLNLGVNLLFGYFLVGDIHRFSFKYDSIHMFNDQFSFSSSSFDCHFDSWSSRIVWVRYSTKTNFFVRQFRIITKFIM